MAVSKTEELTSLQKIGEKVRDGGILGFILVGFGSFAWASSQLFRASIIVFRSGAIFKGIGWALSGGVLLFVGVAGTLTAIAESFPSFQKFIPIPDRKQTK